MRTSGWFGWLLVAFVLLGGCAQLRSNRPPLVVNVRSDGGNCIVTVQREHFAQLPDFIRVSQAQLLEIGRQAKGHRAILIYDVNSPYKCIGAAIVTMQEAGLVVDAAMWDSR